MNTKQIDWRQIVNDILDSGMKQKDLAAKCGISQPYLNEVSKGVATGDLRYGIGACLLSIHKRVMRKGKEKPH